LFIKKIEEKEISKNIFIMTFKVVKIFGLNTSNLESDIISFEFKYGDINYKNIGGVIKLII
jgi:hypothetical protein